MSTVQSRSGGVLPPASEAPTTAYERAWLAALGNDLSDPWPEYGQAALIQAFRAGYGVARAEARIGREFAEGGDPR